ncbi:MAG: hypothetical protein O6649_06230, partial [Gammaproteobacteria bacterium]|nr:hypothetical protein [Gammaproteobacteria bacterium]
TIPSEELTEPLIESDADAPRMLVRGFRIQGVQPREELGITQQSIEQLVISEAQKLVAGAAARGFTLSMFETLTRSISRFYRERGFFLARAYIPEQKVNDGVVTINIVEGFLDQVVFLGNQRYSDDQLNDLFDDLIGEPVFLEDIERAIFIANDFPGLEASALFGPGLKPGSAAIQLNTREDPSSGFLSWDNYGSIYTGEQRLWGNYRVNNLFGQADLVNTNLVYTLDPQNSLYFDVSYQQPVLNNDFLAGGGYSFNTFDVGGNLADLKINGESSILNGYMTYIYRRKRTERMSATLDLSLKSAESKVIDTLDSLDKLTVLSAQALYQGTSWSGAGAYQQLSATLSLGLAGILGAMDSDGDGLSGRLGGSGNLAGGDFSKINIDYLYLRQIAALQSLFFRLSLQKSSDLLTSLEQFSLGGPDTVRAYPVAEALVDDALLVSVEWRADASPDIPQAFFNGLQYLVFFDYAKGSLNDPLNNDIASVTLSGIGFGVELEPYKKFGMKVQIAFATGDESSDNQSLPFYFRFWYDF